MSISLSDYLRDAVACMEFFEKRTARNGELLDIIPAIKDWISLLWILKHWNHGKDNVTLKEEFLSANQIEGCSLCHFMLL